MPRPKSRLKEFEYVLLGKMYAEYFKFADQREILRQANRTKQFKQPLVNGGDKKEEKKKHGLRERKGSNASSIKSTTTTTSSSTSKTNKTTAESILALKRM